MKTRLLIIVGIIVVVAISITFISLAYNQEIKLIMGMQSDERPEPLHIPDPICIVLDRATGSSMTVNECYPLSDFEVLECDRTILEHLAKYSNLLDDDFDGNFAMNLIGLPDGVSQEKFEWCVDFIYEKRFPSTDAKSEKLKLEAEPSLEPEYDYNFDKTWSGLGNRHPAFLGYYIPEICTEDMIKHLVKYSSMFDRNVPYTLEWISMDDSINVDDFDRCVEELLERNPKELENED